MLSMIAPLRMPGLNALFRCFVVAAIANMGWMVTGAMAADTSLPLLNDARERNYGPVNLTHPRVRILTTSDFPPFNFVDAAGRFSGFHIDLAREICVELKIEARCQIQALAYDELEKALEAGSGEIILAGTRVTPQLRERFDFSRPYIGIPARFVRNRSSLMESATESAFSGKTVGLVAGTAHEDMFKAYFPNLSPMSFATPEEMLGALKEMRIDAAFADGVTLPFWVSGQASQGCCTLFDGPFVSEKFLGEGLSGMFRKGDVQLVSAFNQAIATLSASGRLEEIYLRYFPNGLY